MQRIHTVCSRDCPDACSLIFHVDARQQIHSVRADGDHPLTRGMICPRSARDRDRLLTNRVDAPYLKGSAGFKKISWNHALDLASQKLGKALAEQEPQQILFLTYHGNTGMLANAFPERLWNAIGATQTDGALCSKSGHTGISLHYGESYGANPLDIPDMGVVTFWGLNAAVSAAHIWQLARNARKHHQTKIVVVDPIETITAQKADLWIRPKPETDVALVYGLLNQLIADGWNDQDFIEKWTTGFDVLRTEAAKWTPQSVQTITGVPVDELKALRETVGSNQPSLTMIGIGLQHCGSGADQVRAVAMIPAVLGSHRGFFYRTQNTPTPSFRKCTAVSLRLCTSMPKTRLKWWKNSLNLTTFDQDLTVMPTSNIERPTSNIEIAGCLSQRAFKVQCCMFDVLLQELSAYHAGRPGCGDAGTLLSA